MDSLLLITGAGASYDIIAIDRVPIQNITYRPPLTKDLFLFDTALADGSPYSANCLQEHPIASQVGHDFYNRFGKDSDVANAVSLEEYLKELKNSGSPVVRKKFWAVPVYFFYLFHEISKNYTPTRTPGLPSNYQSLLDRVSESNYDQIIWLNLNYDLLADYVIRDSISNKLENFDDYMGLEIQGKNTIKLKYTKPHGSIDWFKTIDESRTNLHEIQIGRAPDGFEQLLSKEVIKAKVAPDGGIAGRPHNGYPAITAPIGEYKFIYQRHIDTIIPDLRNITSVLCIGFSALDIDILDLVNNNLTKIEKLKIVNGSEEAAEQAYERLSDYCKKVKIVAKQVSIFNGGFTQFMQSEISEWLRK